MDRIIGQTRDVVGVGIATSDPEDPLRKEFPQGVHDLAGIASILEASRQTINHTESMVRGLEDDGPAIRARVLLVKPDDQRLPEKIGEQNTLCGRVRHARPPSVEDKLPQHSLSPTRRSSRSLPFVNYPG